MRFNEVSTEVAPPTTIEQLEELFRYCMVRSISFDNGLHDLSINGSSNQRVIVKISSKQWLHEVKVPDFAIDCSLIALYTNNTVSEYSEDEVAAFIVLDTVQLQSFARDVNILHIHFGSDDESVSDELALHHISLQRHSFDDLQLVVYKHSFLKANHTA